MKDILVLLLGLLIIMCVAFFPALIWPSMFAAWSKPLVVWLGLMTAVVIGLFGWFCLKDDFRTGKDGEVANTKDGMQLHMSTTKIIGVLCAADLALRWYLSWQQWQQVVDMLPMLPDTGFQTPSLLPMLVDDAIWAAVFWGTIWLIARGIRVFRGWLSKNPAN